MSKEHEQLTGLLANKQIEKDWAYEFVVGQVGGNRLILLQCGMGKVNAAVGCTTLLHRYHPDYIISTGCAGGIDERLKIMDIVVGKQCCYHDVEMGFEPGQLQGLPARFDGDASLVEKAMQLQADVPGLPTFHAGLICTGDQFITDHTRQAAIKAQFADGLAVDMESAAIAQACLIHGVPFLSFRTISDIPGSDGHEQQYNDFWDKMADGSFAATRAFITGL